MLAAAVAAANYHKMAATPAAVPLFLQHQPVFGGRRQPQNARFLISPCAFAKHQVIVRSQPPPAFAALRAVGRARPALCEAAIRLQFEGVPPARGRKLVARGTEHHLLIAVFLMGVNPVLRQCVLLYLVAHTFILTFTFHWPCVVHPTPRSFARPLPPLT